MDHIFVADIHIKLGQKNVPSEWQHNRVMLLAKELNEYKDKTLVIGGDLLDVAKPTMPEVCLMYDFLRALEHEEIILIPGNHEMLTKKKDCFEVCEQIFKDLNVTLVRDFQTINNVDYIPYNILFSDSWSTPKSTLAVTHVRGEIPPHVKPEVELSKFSHYEKVFCGDLHSRKNSQLNLIYPGSPYTTSFHRSVSKGANGIILFDSNTGDHEWEELNLPQLLRLTITDPEEAVPGEYHHTLYEIEGNLADLSKVKNNELLDKKVAKDIVTPPTLELTGDISDELQTYLKGVKDIKGEGMSRLLTIFKEALQGVDDV